MKSHRLIFALSVGFFLTSCKEKMPVEPNLYTYQMPEQLHDGWSISSLDKEGMDTGVIEQVTSKIMSKQFRGIHSLLIVKSGALVHEVYFEDYNRSSLHTLYSITKSISSALIGIAIDQGLIQSVEDTVLSFFPQYSTQDTDKLKIKLRHLLTLTSGLRWDEKSYPYSDPRNTECCREREENSPFLCDRLWGTNYSYST